MAELISDVANDADKLKSKILELITEYIRLTPEDIETLYKTSGFIHVYPTRREALDNMIEDIGSARKSIEMYARVYFSELIKEPKFISAIEKAILKGTEKNGFRIRNFSTDYSNDYLVGILWKKEDSSHIKEWQNIDDYKNHLKRGNAIFDQIKDLFSNNKDVVFERAYLKSDSLLPFSILSIDDEILYVSFYDLSPKYGTHAPTVRLVHKENKLWVDLFLGYKQNIEATGI